MVEPRLVESERAVVRELAVLAAERARADKEADAAFRAREAAAGNELETARYRLVADFHAEQENRKGEFEAVRREIDGRFVAESRATQKWYARARRRAHEAYKAERSDAEREYKDARWTMTTVFEAARTKARDSYQEFRRKVDGHLDRVRKIREEASRALGPWAPDDWGDGGDGAAAVKVGDEDLLVRLPERLKAAEEQFERSRNLLLLRFVRGPWFWVLVVIAWLGAAALGGLPPNFSPAWLAAVTALALVLGGAVFAGLRAAARAQVRRVHRPLAAAVAETEALCRQCRSQAARAHRRQLDRNRDRYVAERRRLDEGYRQRAVEIRERRRRDLAAADLEAQRKFAEIKGRRDAAAAAADAKYPRLIETCKERFEAESHRIQDTHRREVAGARQEYEQAKGAARTAWEEGLARVRSRAEDVAREDRRLCPPWDDPSWMAWTPPREVPPVLRFGEFTVRLADFPDGVPPDEPSAQEVAFRLPALVPFPNPGSLLFQIGSGGRSEAEAALQAVMLRLLTSVPPGKVRFTIVDPLGLGRSFAAFMHLADQDEALVTSRIWTEPAHIEQRLADLTAHMETVIQKFLRNQFASLEEYNAQAGEVAEPFRVLVVANFPANFGAEAVRRLASIVSSGARCGVATLITVDPTLPLPSGFSLAELERHGARLVWDEARYRWVEPELGRFAFRLDAPPEPDFTTRLLLEVGRRAQEAGRVEVPFGLVAPPPESWWSGDTGREVAVALGRAGATKKQYLRLGKGTAQHVLIAGKTGSGKSTLLHALVTNLSLLYGPDEIELYLVDFKEGVEFKAYATHELPHARLVAIESEREFGLSVLQRREGELKQRGDRFRAAGVQDLPGYRQATGAPLPRILLIVDEFQMFFVEDDKIAQDAALLLDRLVRQGRAFGIHVLLGSQTLGGAYSLARSTIGQMAVRIALQCSEADAPLILSDDNTAARLLSRPGEAIYNDANGLVEGNDFFQVVWLPDELREDYLRKVAQLARQRGFVPPQPQIVFEGKAPAEVGKNHLLAGLLAAPGWPPRVAAARAWLGEAMAIKDPTAATLRRQTGSHLLVVGQSDEAALAVLGTAFISLAAQYPPAEPDATAGARLFVLDGSPGEGASEGYWTRLAGAVPHPVRLGGWRDVPDMLAEVAAEVERRRDGHESGGPEFFLLVYALQRFRELRPPEEDFGFGRREEGPPPPSKLFGTILRDGAAVGVHVLAWCDSLANVTRAVDRQGLREFDMRVLFQMSAADSSTLIDTPAASRLGLHRALFYSEERGQPEKFRPYGLPSAEWLDRVRQQLGRKLEAQAGV